jgi:fermentation-respiration switch protein FrsA (DUF1100 family)
MLKKTLITLLFLYLLFLIGFYFFQEKVIFQSKKLDKNYLFDFSKNFEEVMIKATDGATISALHFKIENPKGVLLYFHGNKGNLKRWGDLVSPYTNYNYDVFVIDYRGYGKSNGKRSEKIMYDDAQVVYEYLKKSFDETKIVVYGRSLGATFATFIAAQNKPRQLVLEAPFYSLISTVRSKVAFVPYGMLLKYKFESYEFISKVTTPTTIFHGDKDRLISLEFGKKLYEASNTEITEFIMIKEGTHHNLTTFNEYKEKMKAILD